MINAEPESRGGSQRGEKINAEARRRGVAEGRREGGEDERTAEAVITNLSLVV